MEIPETPQAESSSNEIEEGIQTFSGVKNEKHTNVVSHSKVFFYRYVCSISCAIIYIPRIIENNPNLLKFCLRGIIDTDFSLSFKNRGKRKNFYPVLMASFGNRNIMESVKRSLSSLGFNVSTCIVSKYDNRYNKSSFGYQVTLNGEKNIEQWQSSIGSHNPRLETRYLIWKKFGSLAPHLSIKERLEILKNKK